MAPEDFCFIRPGEGPKSDSPCYKNLMAVPSAQIIKKILEGIIVPEMQVVKDRLASIEGEGKSIHSEIKRLDDKVDNLDKRLNEKIDNLDKRLPAQHTLIDEILTFTNKRLDEAIDIRERLAALEAKVGH